MNNTETITSQLYLNFYKFEGPIKKEHIKFWLLHRKQASLESMIEFNDKLKEFSDALSEVVSELTEHTVYKEVFDNVYFYSDVLGKNKSTFNQWKKKGFFKNEFGTERKQKVTLEEIENFLNDRRFKGYRKIWENRTK